MKKSLLSALIACFMVASASGCSDKSESKKDDKSSKAEITTSAEKTTSSDDGYSVVEKSGGKFVIKGLSGKKVSELSDEGFNVSGYSRSSDIVILSLSNSEYTDDKLTEFADSLNGKTIKELVGKYDISISYSRFNDKYSFSSYIGTASFKCDIEHGAEAVKKHEDETFFDLEEAEEIQSDVLENVELSSISFEMTLDKASAKKLVEVEDLDTDYIKSIADELIVNEVYYEIG